MQVIPSWDVDVANAGDYEVLVRYTCAAGDVGVRVRLTREAAGKQRIRLQLTCCRLLIHRCTTSRCGVKKSHYFVKALTRCPSVLCTYLPVVAHFVCPDEIPGSQPLMCIRSNWFVGETPHGPVRTSFSTKEVSCASRLCVMPISNFVEHGYSKTTRSQCRGRVSKEWIDFTTCTNLR